MRSQKISIANHTGDIHGHPCTAPRAAQTVYNYKPQDQEAISFLKEAAVAYRLVNLADCSFTAGMKAKITGINETPTLILKGRIIKGLEGIKQAIQQIKTQPE